jgi:hypothetical protein
MSSSIKQRGIALHIIMSAFQTAGVEYGVSYWRTNCGLHTQAALALRPSVVRRGPQYAVPAPATTTFVETVEFSMYQASQMSGSLSLSRCALKIVTPSVKAPLGDGPVKPPANPEQQFARNWNLVYSKQEQQPRLCQAAEWLILLHCNGKNAIFSEVRQGKVRSFYSKSAHSTMAILAYREWGCIL